MRPSGTSEQSVPADIRQCRGDGVGAALQAFPDAPDCAELLVGDPRRAAHVQSLNVAAEDKDFSILKDGDLRWRNSVRQGRGTAFMTRVFFFMFHSPINRSWYSF